jgi:hypothetical protein
MIRNIKDLSLKERLRLMFFNKMTRSRKRKVKINKVRKKY